jgi:glycosyltransferase involved in cell wall biosynthesis
MNAVFAHDHIFVASPDGTRYSPGKLPYAVWQRYLRFFDSLTVLARQRGVKSPHEYADLSVASGDNVHFRPLPSLSGPAARLRHRADARSIASEVIASADVLIARLPSEIGSLALRIASSLEKPIAVEVVGCAWDALWNYGTMLGRLYAPVAYVRTKRQVRRAPFAIYVSREFLPTRYPCEGRTAFVSDVRIAPVDHDVLRKRIERIQREQGTARLGLIGSLLPYKGIDTALRALRLLRATTEPCRLLILGAGDQERWKRLARALGVVEQVEFCGVLPAGESVSAWLDDIDVYIQPSRQEGLPRALAEAMSRGCPCIGSTAGGIPELLDRSCLHPPRSASTLARLLSTAVVDRQWQVCQARRNFAEAQLYWRDRLDREWDDFWTQFAETARRHTMQ